MMATETSIDLDQVPTGFWLPYPSISRLQYGSLNLPQNKNPYVDYFNIQCSYFAYDDIKLIKHLISKINADETRQDILVNLKTHEEFKALDDRDLQQTLNLAARLLVLCDVGLVYGQVNPNRHLLWEDSMTLRNQVSQYFEDFAPQLDDRVRLPKTFDAWSIHKIGGIKIQLTDNLFDHLLLVNDDTVVLVFHHVSFLELQTSECILPEKLVQETLASISLLFPQSEYASPRRVAKEKREWFARLRESHLTDTQCEADERLAHRGTLQADSRQIEKFHYWRDRLVVLKQAYDDSTPATISQWWFDRRNGPQWYTFWVAILVLIITTLLGLIQCIESALQVYKAYHPS